MLAHNPDTKDEIPDLPWHLMLSGHTHGGQFVCPFIGGSPFCVVKDRRFVAGLKAWEGRLVHVSRGLGSIKGIRVNCPPEISMLSIG